MLEALAPETAVEIAVIREVTAGNETRRRNLSGRDLT
jgi:hypothetical protein